MDSGSKHRKALTNSPHYLTVEGFFKVSVLEVMTRYVRNQFTDPAPGVAAAVKQSAKQRSVSAIKGQAALASSGSRSGSKRFFKRRVVKKAFYSDEEDESGEEEVELGKEEDEKLKPEVGSIFTGENADTEGDLVGIFGVIL